MKYFPLNHKCRIYPKERQIKQFQMTFDSCHFLYNLLLKRYKKDYQNKNIPNNLKKYLKSLSEQYKTEYSSISNLDESTIDDVLSNLLRAIHQKRNPIKIKPKDDKKRVKSFLIKDKDGINLTNNVLQLDKYGKLKLYYGKLIKFIKVISYRVLYQNKKWYVIVTIRSDDIIPFDKTGKKVGIDLGIKSLITLSNGKRYNPPDLSDLNNEIDILNQKLSTKRKNSRNYNLIIDKLNSKYSHRNNIILDYYHKISTQLVREYDVIAMESLSIQEMLKDHRFSKNIFQSNWYKLVEMIRYKCRIYGKTFIQVNKNFPSTKLCNNCGYKYQDITIDVRMWECPDCGEIHDRDVNAAINLLNQALLYV